MGEIWNDAKIWLIGAGVVLAAGVLIKKYSGPVKSACFAAGVQCSRFLRKLLGKKRAEKVERQIQDLLNGMLDALHEGLNQDDDNGG